MAGAQGTIGTRPDWTRGVTGVPFDVAVRICPSPQGAGGKPNIVAARNRVSLIQLDSGAAKPENEYDVNFVYGAEATNVDITKRHVEPLVKKALEGYNTCIIIFGASGSGKTLTLEGARARDSKSSSEGDGIVHQAIDVLFKLLNDKAVSVGEKVAQQRRMPGSKAYDFFVESSFVEVYNETCHDLYQKGDAVHANLPIYEDDSEGYQISGLTFRMAKTDQEMRANFNYGRILRETQVPDMGNVHERAAAIFTIYIAQYSPAAMHGQEDNIMVSHVSFVDMPASERLAMEPDLLRLREGPLLNKGLLSFASTMSTLARDGSSQFVNYEESLLVKLLSEALGGNSMALMLGTLKQGDWEGSTATLQQLMHAKKAKNFPIINHGRARGLLQKLRRRLLALLEERETLRDQLNEVPADGDPNSVAVSIARVRDLESRLNAEREEMAVITHEKQALQARLSKLREAETGDLQERAELQDALIRSEELRLALARTLIDAQMDMNDKEAEWAGEKLELEQKLAEAEAGTLEGNVKAGDHVGLVQERDELNAQLLATQEALSRREAEVEELQHEIEDQQAEIRKLNQELNLIGGGDGEGAFDLEDDGTEGDSIEAKRRKLFVALKRKTREVAELQSAMRELQKELDTLRNSRAITRAGLDEVREAYRRKLEANMRDITDMSRAIAIMQDDPSTGLKVTPEDLFNTFQRLTDENVRVTEDREKEMRHDLDELHGRHVEMKRKFRTLYLAYRQLRYLIEDRWPPNGQPPAPQVPTEDEVLGAAFEDISRSEEEADRRLMARLRERTAHLDSQLAALKIAETAGEKGIKLKPSNLLALSREQQGNDKFVEMPEMLRFENDKLREELDRFKSLVGPGPGAVNERLLQENTLLIGQVKALSGGDKGRAQLAADVSKLQIENDMLKRNGGQGPDARSASDAVREFSNKTQAELERKLAHAEARRVMAEEQLESMQKYLTKATVQYQKEIVRLRTIVGQLDPRMLKANPLKGS